MLYSSQGGVSIERSALHEREPDDKSEDSPLIGEEDSDSSAKESQHVGSISRSKVTCLSLSWGKSLSSQQFLFCMQAGGNFRLVVGPYYYSPLLQWSLISTNTLTTKFWVKRTHAHSPCRAPIETVQNFTA